MDPSNNNPKPTESPTKAAPEQQTTATSALTPELGQNSFALQSRANSSTDAGSQGDDNRQAESLSSMSNHCAPSSSTSSSFNTAFCYCPVCFRRNAIAALGSPSCINIGDKIPNVAITQSQPRAELDRGEEGEDEEVPTSTQAPRQKVLVKRAPNATDSNDTESDSETVDSNANKQPIDVSDQQVPSAVFLPSDQFSTPSVSPSPSYNSDTEDPFPLSVREHQWDAIQRGIISLSQQTAFYSAVSTQALSQTLDLVRRVRELEYGVAPINMVNQLVADDYESEIDEFSTVSATEQDDTNSLEDGPGYNTQGLIIIDVDDDNFNSSEDDPPEQTFGGKFPF